MGTQRAGVERPPIASEVECGKDGGEGVGCGAAVQWRRLRRPDAIALNILPCFLWMEDWREGRGVELSWRDSIEAKWAYFLPILTSFGLCKTQKDVHFGAL